MMLGLIARRVVFYDTKDWLGPWGRIAKSSSKINPADGTNQVP
jgi:hypothetical protein